MRHPPMVINVLRNRYGEGLPRNENSGRDLPHSIQ